MKIRTAIPAIIAITALAFLPFVAAQQGTYEKALVLEETQLKLQEAIALYQQVVEESSDKALAAQAQLRIGLCYEKLGASEAEKAFRKVIENYADQPAAARARERLSAMKDPATAASFGSGELVMRQSPVPAGQPSPDGKFIAFVDYDSSDNAADLVLYEIATGVKKPLTNLGAGKPKTSYSMVNEPVSWSADGSQIAFTTLLTDTDSARGELLTVSHDGSNLRVIPADFGDWASIAGWTSDGKALIAVFMSREKGNSIQRISIPTGNLEEIRVLAKAGPAYLSPDFAYIAYGVSSGTGDALNGDIHVVPVDGSSDVIVVDHPANDHLLGWAGDSSYIIFFSNRNGDPAIWAQAIKEGKRDGDPQRLASVAESAKGLGPTRDGAFYFVESRRPGTDVYIAQIDLKTGKTLKTPENVEPAYARHASTPFWSPSGEYLGYLVRGSTAFYKTLRLFSPKNRSGRDIALNFSATTLQQTPRWDPAEKHIYLTGSAAGQTNGLYEIEVSTGQSRLIYQSKPMEYIRAWSSDGAVVFSSRVDRSVKSSDRIDEIIRKDLKTGEESEFLRSNKPGEAIRGAWLSNNGKWLGLSMEVSDSAWFCVMPTAGGAIRQLAKVGSSAFGAYFFWSPNEDGVLFERKTSREGRYGLAYLPSFDAQDLIELDLEMPRINGLTFHPDGKTVAFNTISPSESKVWVMENFLPAKK